MTYEITVPGEPVAKARPKFTRSGHTYTPDKTESYESLIRRTFTDKYGQPMIQGAFAATIIAYFSIPQSASKKAKAAMSAGTIRPCKKPDGDNVIKIVLDALNKVAYGDDKQAVSITIEKYYAELPRLVVRISELMEG